MTTYGYGRVSTTDQNPQMQLDALQAAGCDEVRWETGSGIKADRPVWTELLDALQAEDVLVVWKLDRIGRSTQDLLRIIAILDERGAHLRCLTQPIDTTTPHGRLLFTLLAAVAEYERDLIRERTLAGLEAARKKGRRGGRPQALTTDQKTLVRQLSAQGKSQREIAALVGASQSTIGRVLREITSPAPR